MVILDCNICWNVNCCFAC